MKKTSLIKFFIILFAVIGFIFTSCKKDKTNEEVTDTTSLQQLSKDETDIQSASDEGMNDANDVMAHGSTKSLNWLPCHATVDSASIVDDTITYTITYNGLNCIGNRSRTGTIKVKRNINTPWYQAGCKVYAQFINFKITKVSGKSITINGTKLFENVSGGLVLNLGNGSTSTVIHKVSGVILATFDDTSTRTWHISRQRTFTGIFPNQVVMTTDGFGTESTYSNLEAWGINRHGELFYSQINQSVVHKQTCNWDPVSGKIIHQIPGNSKSVTITFGYDDNNQLVSFSGTICPTRCKLDWLKNSHTGTLYIQI